MQNPTVFVIDDDYAVRDSLSLLLRAERLHHKTYETATAFLNDLGPGASGCVVTDVRMPGMDGVELLRLLMDRRAKLPVVIMTGHADVPLAVEAMKLGAMDFIEKPFDSHVLLRAVRQCLEALEDVQRTDEVRSRIQQRIDLLTTRERQVLDMLVDGKANRMMAEDLGISVRTVEIYRANVMAKMLADSLSELVRMCLTARAA